MSAMGQGGWLTNYRGWGARTEADLLWLAFVGNRAGITWCGFEEREAKSDVSTSF